ncbi:uncharacterized protein LOC131973247 isoform X2 [Centropristis striata]|uniref:uncharacterized protein LOC131973247 isoform X2 n=1 Tax=Centropristis striata TaxID=184440 RepID=UPI0027DF6B81|nr:uncharacterized protein LOC131973247 isoform X2 [Centropristis striata]
MGELTIMALPFGVSWLCTLLLWGCICFPPQKGYNIAHAYSLNDEEFSSHAGMLVPQTSNHFHSGASLNTNQDSASPRDDLQDMRPQSFVHPENNEATGSGTSFSEDIMQSKPDLDHNVPSALSVQEYEHEGSENQHPLGLLLKEHTQENTVEGVSFPTIKAFKQFIERMKSSFLIPGTDLGTHFQIAREKTENEMASYPESIEGEPDTSYRSTSAKEGAAPDAVRLNEVWSGPMNIAFEQSAQDAKYQMPSESLSVPDPVDSTALISTSVYDNQDLGLDSAYPHHILAPTEPFSSNDESFNSGGLFGKSPDIFTNVRNEDQSISYKLPEEIPSGSFFGEDLSFDGHVTVSPVNVLPSQDFNYYSSKTPLTSEKNIQQTKYTSQSKDFLTGDKMQSGGFEPGNDFQSEELGRLTPAKVLSAPKPPSFNFYHLPASTGSGSSGSNYPSPQSSSAHVGVQTGRPHDAQNQAFNTKQPDGFHLMFTVKPSSSLHGSNRYDPSTLTAHEDEEKSDISKHNQASATQGPEHMAGNSRILLSSGLASSQSGVSSQFRDVDENVNSLTNLAPTSASERLFSRLAGNKIMSRNFGIKNIISDKRGARNPLGSFSAPLRRGISLNSDYMIATIAGHPKTTMQVNKDLLPSSPGRKMRMRSLQFYSHLL